MLTLYYTVCEPVNTNPQTVEYHIWYLVKWPFTISGMVKYQVTMGFLPTAAWYSDSGILPFLSQYFTEEYFPLCQMLLMVLQLGLGLIRVQHQKPVTMASVKFRWENWRFNKIDAEQ